MTKWEYWTDTQDVQHNTFKGEKKRLVQLAERLNEAGEAGWELIDYELVPVSGPMTVKTHVALMIFKRPRPE